MSFSFFPYWMECACVNMCAVSSLTAKNWYSPPRFHILLMGKVNQLVVRGKAWNRAENVTKEGEERKERISIPYTKYSDVNKKILNGYLTESHRRKAWEKKRSLHCAAFFFVTQLYPLYQPFIFPAANSEHIYNKNWGSICYNLLRLQISN